jgi:nitrogen fixation/metabolism regulation signal transduction histidine kinase
MIERLIFVLAAIVSGFLSMGFLAGSAGLAGAASVTWWAFAVFFAIGALVFTLLATEP